MTKNIVIKADYLNDNGKWYRTEKIVNDDVLCKRKDNNQESFFTKEHFFSTMTLLGIEEDEVERDEERNTFLSLNDYSQKILNNEMEI